MKFVAFNLVVGAALAYLVVADRWDAGETDATAHPIATAAAAELPLPAAPVPASVVEPRPVVAPVSVPAPAAPVRREQAALPQIIPPTVPDPVRIDGQIAPKTDPAPPVPSPREAAPVEPAMSTAERGRSLRDLARDMEGRFVRGVQ